MVHRRSLIHIVLGIIGLAALTAYITRETAA